MSNVRTNGYPLMEVIQMKIRIHAIGKIKEAYLKIGIDELSVSPAYTLALRERISKIDTNEVDISKFI